MIIMKMREEEIYGLSPRFLHEVIAKLDNTRTCIEDQMPSPQIKMITGCCTAERQTICGRARQRTACPVNLQINTHNLDQPINGLKQRIPLILQIAYTHNQCVTGRMRNASLSDADKQDRH